jgi:predicted metal-dependent HD superfamily phosphohydrolase
VGAAPLTDLAGWWPLPDRDDLRERLCRAYDDPARGYHDLRHLAEVLQRLDELMPAGHPTRDVVLLAAWFHDAVYDGSTAGDNEERSARMAERQLAATPYAAEVARLVRLTATHRPADDDLDGQLLCDADLAILAAPPQRYDEYTAGVRQEYAAIPDRAFRAGRRRVLEDLLAKDSLFHTEAARERWERRARANVQAEIEELSR